MTVTVATPDGFTIGDVVAKLNGTSGPVLIDNIQGNLLTLRTPISDLHVGDLLVTAHFPRTATATPLFTSGDLIVFSVDVPGALRTGDLITRLGDTDSTIDPASLAVVVLSSGSSVVLSGASNLNAGDRLVPVGFRRRAIVVTPPTAAAPNTVTVERSLDIRLGDLAGPLAAYLETSGAQQIASITANALTLGAPIDRVLSLLGVTMLAGAPQPTTGTVSGVVTNAANSSAIPGATVSSDTGQSATSGGDGTYVLTGVPAGTRQVTVSAAGFTSQTKSANVQASVTTTLDFALQPAPQPTKAIAECITYNVTGPKAPNKQSLVVTVRVLDDFSNPVSGASVSATIKRGTTTVASASGTTNPSGNVTYTVKNASNGTYVTTVTAINASGLQFEGTTPANQFTKGTDPVPDTDCRGDNPQPSDATVGPRGRAQHGSPAWSHAHQVKARHEDELFAVEGVVGVGLGRGADGSPQIEVFLDSDRPDSRRRIPHEVEDVSTETVVTGPFTAY